MSAKRSGAHWNMMLVAAVAFGLSARATAQMAGAASAPTTAVSSGVFGGMSPFAGSPVNTLAFAPSRRSNLVFTQVVPRLVVGQTFRMAVGEIVGGKTVSSLNTVVWSSTDPLTISVDHH